MSTCFSNNITVHHFFADFDAWYHRYKINYSIFTFIFAVISHDINISQRRPSAIFNVRNMLFWLRDLCQSVILFLCTKLRVNRKINCRNIAKDNSQKTILRYFKFAKTWFFLSRDHSWNQTLHRHSKYHRNRWKPFSYWKSSFGYIYTLFIVQLMRKLLCRSRFRLSHRL